MAEMEDLHSELTELFGDIRNDLFFWPSGKLRTQAPGYSIRDVPTYTKRTDDVSVAEMASWGPLSVTSAAQAKREAERVRRSAAERARRAALGAKEQGHIIAARAEKVAALLAQGLTGAQIAKQLGLSQAQVSLARKKAGLSLPLGTNQFKVRCA